MRFKEFDPKHKKHDQQVDEILPAIGMGLRAVGGAAIQATRAAAGMGARAVGAGASALGRGALAVGKEVGKQAIGAVGSAAKSAVSTAAGGTPSIPAVGSEIVLPDKDTKRPASYTIKGVSGNDVELSPVTTAAKTNDPKVSVKVNKRDLENTLKAVSPQSQDKRTL